MMEFQNQKSQRLEHVDLSKKGSVDEPILELVSFINSLPNYFTTSSCSGRIILFESAVENVDDNPSIDKEVSIPMKIGKKGCKWLFVSHSSVMSDEQDYSFSKASSCSGNAVFKFEAMVMHIQCKTLEDAQKMHQAAMAAGFRNSGISVGGKRKIILGVRSTHGLEAPLTKDGRLLVTQEYYDHLVECANHKMKENFIRINRFFDNVKVLTKQNTDSMDKEGKRNKRKKKKEMKQVSQIGKRGDHEENGSSSSPQCVAGSSLLHGNNSENEDTSDFSLFMFNDT